MKENKIDYKQELSKSEALLKELETRGAKVLSRYDIEIASQGNAVEALQLAKYLVSNHIRYYRKLLDNTVEQLQLF